MAPFFSSTDSMGDQVFFSLACDLRTLGCGHWSCVTCRLAMDTQEIARAGGLETTREKPPVPSEKFPGQFVSSDAGSSNLRYGRPIRVLSSTLSFLMTLVSSPEVDHEPECKEREGTVKVGSQSEDVELFCGTRAVAQIICDAIESSFADAVGRAPRKNRSVPFLY